MKYIKPTYEKEEIDVTDVILASPDSENKIILTETSSTDAQIWASIFDIIGSK
jgi:hypothetical protein